MRRLFVRSFATAFVAFAVVFGAEFFIEWHRAGYPGWGSVSWAGVKNEKLVDVLSPMARAYNNVLAMLIATIGLAIPLTANMHTPKLIEMFLRDRINRWVLGYIAFGAAHVLWVGYMIGPNFAPTWSIALSVYMALIGWALLIPYFFYVVRFVDPSRLVIRIRDAATEIVEESMSIEGDASGRVSTPPSPRVTSSKSFEPPTMVKTTSRSARSAGESTTVAPSSASGSAFARVRL
jgi:uncharacterized membrane protein